MHVIIEFEDLVGWILLGIFVVVLGIGSFCTLLVALLIRDKFRRWRKKRQERKEDQEGGTKR